MDDEDFLLDHARKVYASDSFLLFRHKYEKSKALSLDVTSESGCEIKYKVKRTVNLHSYKVTAYYLGDEVECRCNRFAVTGILYSHALAVLRCLQVEEVPNQYLVKWRMKSAKKSSVRKTPSQKRRHLMGDTSQKSRRIHSSSDDCLRGDLSKSWIKTDGENETEKGNFDLIWTDHDACDGFHHHLGSPLLRHAKELNTSKVYNLFKKEYRKFEYLLDLPLHQGTYQRGLIYHFEGLGYGGVYEKTVHAEARNETVKCSCRMFRKTGILCSHALVVFDIINIVKIPHQYIVPAFFKNPSMSVWQKNHGVYPEMLRFALHMIKTNGRTSRASFRGLGEGEESPDALEEELRELSQQEEMIVSKEEEMMGRVRFYDDYLIKDSTFKKPETRKRELLDYSSFPLSNAFYRSFRSAALRVCFN